MKHHYSWLCKIGLHDYEDIVESAELIYKKGYTQSITLFDKACLNCGKVNLIATKAKEKDKLESEMAKQRLLKVERQAKEENNRIIERKKLAKKLWFDSLPEDKKSEFFCEEI